MSDFFPISYGVPQMEMWSTLVPSLLLVLAGSVYFFCKRRYSYFEKRGVKSLAPLPFIGSLWRSMIGRKHMVDDITDAYNTFPGEKYFGIFEGVKPVLVIKDPEIIKKVLVKDFDHFVDHRNMIINDENDDSLPAKALIFLRGQKWREMRGALSPAFTGSKMRMMLPFMSNISQQVVEYIKAEAKEDKKGKLTEPMEMYDLFTRFATDVIASCAFGLKVDSLKDKENEFYSLGKSIVNFKTIVFACVTVFPKLSKLLGIKIFSDKVTDFFRDVVSGTIKHREQNKIIRHDMIQLLMDAKHGTLKNATQKDDDALGFATVQESEMKTAKIQWTDDELAAQAFIFFLAGFNTASTALTFLVHELVLNPDIQEKLRAEVDACHSKNPELIYEDIQELKYMDMVISENLRKWVSGVLLDRECAKDYTFEPPRPGYKPYTIKKNQHLYIYVHPIHLDEKYYLNPEKFDPERFSDERKQDIQPFTYMPFGVGPRNCIGSRFALMEIKAILYHLMLNFELVSCEKTTNPIRLKKSLRLEVDNGSWIRFKSRH